MARGFLLIKLALIMTVLLNTYCPVMAEDFEAFYIYGVPYIRQADPYWCGPASLSMVLNYWGYEINQSEVAAHVYNPKSKLTFISNMTEFPREIGFYSEVVSPANIGLLKSYLHEGIPLIVLQKFSYENTYGHFRVVIGYNDKERTVITHDPILGENYTLSYESFSKLWQPGSTFTTVNWTLIIVPENKVLIELMEEHQVNLNTNYTAIMRRKEYEDLRLRFEALTEELRSLKEIAVFFIIAVSVLSVTNIYTLLKLHRSRRIKTFNP